MSAAHGRSVVVMHIGFLERMARHVDAPPIFMKEAVALRAFLDEHDALAKDATRLNWLTTQCEVEVRSPPLAGGAELLWRDGLRPRTTHGNTLREAIDAANSDTAINGAHHPNQGDAG